MDMLSQVLLKTKQQQALVQLANVLANRLICELYLQEGEGLSEFLNIYPKVSNHQALRIWVKRWLNQSYDDYLITDEIKIDSIYHQLLVDLQRQIPIFIQ